MSRRYVLVRIFSTAPVTEEQFAKATTASILTYFGEIGLSRISPKLIRFDSRRSSAVLAVAKDYIVEMQTALALIGQIGETDASILPLKMSGTIKGVS